MCVNPSASAVKHTSGMDEQQKRDIGPLIGARHLQLSLLFFLTIVISGVRYSVSVAIIAMTDPKMNSNPDVPTYEWDNKNVILSSFYWGYIVLQVFSAEITRFWGTKLVLLICMSVNVMAVLSIPLVAHHFGSYGVVVCRVIQGLFQGSFYPGIYAMLGEWAPAEERSLMAATTSAGGIIGIIITMPLTAFFCKSWYGWPLCYYFYGSLGLLWTLFFYSFGSNSPRVCKHISEAEKIYIESSLNKQGERSIKMAPWKDILSSMPVLAVTVSQIGISWEQQTILSQMPTFMNGVLGFDLQSNGFLSGLPYVVSLCVCMSVGRISDYVTNMNYLSRGAARKLFSTISSTGAAASLLCLSLLPKSQVGSMCTLVLAVALDAISHGGSTPNVIDLSPNYSGIIMSIANACANVSSIISPLVVQVIVTDETSSWRWSIVFCIGAAMVVVTNLFYVCFASGDVQPWNYANVPEDPEKHDIPTSQV